MTKGPGPGERRPFVGAPRAGRDEDDNDRHLVEIACAMAAASLEVVISRSLAEFLA
jgi:hypothetical protein